MQQWPPRTQKSTWQFSHFLHFIPHVHIPGRVLALIASSVASHLTLPAGMDAEKKNLTSKNSVKRNTGMGDVVPQPNGKRRQVIGAGKRSLGTLRPGDERRARCKRMSRRSAPKSQQGPVYNTASHSLPLNRFTACRYVLSRGAIPCALALYTYRPHFLGPRVRVKGAKQS